MATKPWDRAILAEITVPAAVEVVWQAWTTTAGVTSFFAPGGRVELRPGGPYEIYFAPDAPAGQRGAEGTQVLTFTAPRMLAVTWNNPPSLAPIRPQMTHLQLWFDPLENQRARLTLKHSGWGPGEIWDQALAYFDRAWKQIVLPRLVYRFQHGPVDWDNPPDLA